MRRDGRGIPTADEVALWREVMAHFYGEERLGSLDEDDEEGEAEDSPPPALGRLEDASPPSEGSHGSRTGGSPRVSVAGTVGGFSVASLQGKLEALYDPNAEELGPYLLRMGRVIGALNNLGQTAPDGALEMVTRKAELMIEVYAEFGVLDKPKAVRYLRDKFMAFSVDDALDPHEKENSIVALGELIQQLGGKPSRQDSKLFSTPSDGKNGSQAEARGPSVRTRLECWADPYRGGLSRAVWSRVWVEASRKASCSRDRARSVEARKSRVRSRWFRARRARFGSRDGRTNEGPEGGVGRPRKGFHGHCG